jgi:hypothetical protein
MVLHVMVGISGFSTSKKQDTKQAKAALMARLRCAADFLRLVRRTWTIHFLRAPRPLGKAGPLVLCPLCFAPLK